MSGLFPGHATGTLKNDGSAAAAVFSQGVEFGNLEFIQYHPTTVPVSGKNLLISEAARSEGGRLYIERNGVPWYFLEELCGPEGNLVSRDLAVRKMYEVCSRPDCRPPVYLDMREIPEVAWQKRLEGIKEECGKFLNINPEKTPVPIEPAVHYFMGGILVDERHRANKNFLYAVGECACQYHGANRLGGNSMLGALYGGKVAARTAVEELEKYRAAACGFQEKGNIPEKNFETQREDGALRRRTEEILSGCMGTVREETELQKAVRELEKMWKREHLAPEERNRILLVSAMVMFALERRESRGAHIRSDYPDARPEFQKSTAAYFDGKQVRIRFRDIPADKEAGNV